MLKREKNQLKKDRDKKNMSETVIRKKYLWKQWHEKKNKWKKIMKSPNAPWEGRAVPLQRQDPEHF